jgi:UDP-N-acetyl-D-glucosamine dehydrogenase
LSDLDAVLICVPTPLGKHREPDLGHIQATAESIAPNIRPGQLIVLESTTYPGTTEEFLVPLLESGNPRGLRASKEPDDERFYVAYSPEREDPGNSEFNPRAIPKIVSGCDSTALEMAQLLYKSIYTRIVSVSSPRVAEMTKLLENIYRCVNIALVNELKQLSHRMDIDIFEVIDAAKTKPFGFQAFYPGPGLGGHCIPIDPFYLSWRARQYDFATKFIELAGEINSAMPEYVVARTAEALNSHSKPLNGARILILGVAYKKDVDDVRESPSLVIIELLRKRGANVAYNDPFCQTVVIKSKCARAMSTASLDDLETYDCVLIATDHSQYNYPDIVSKAQLVVDTRNATKGISSDKIVHC